MAKVAADPQLKEYKGDSGLVQRWIDEISLVENSNEQQSFEKHGERIQKKYKNAQLVGNYNPQTPARVTFNVLWSNCQVLEPALYSRMPKVVAERIFKDHDPIGRFAAKIAERATQFNVTTQQDKFNYNVSMCVQDRLLVGRGTGWLVYKADFEDETDQEGNALVNESGQPVQRIKPNSEKVEFVHLNYCDYLESKARTQYEIRWRTRVMYYTHQEAVDEFGEEVAKGLNYASNPYEKKKKDQNDPDFLQQARVYQVYDLDSKQVLFVSPGYSEKPLKKAKDPLKLKDFWCSPIPLLATCTSDSTYPTPDFIIYESLADELNFVAQRLNAMTDCIRLVGLVAQQHNKDIKEMLRMDDGELKPLQNYMAFAEKGGLAAMVNWLPFENAANAIPILEQRFFNLKSMIDEITSMPDIIRGSSDPNDPVYSQQQKSHWTVIKLIKKQQDVQRFCREIVSKMGEIIFEPGFFSDETIWLMAGVAQMAPEEQEMFYPALQLLRDDRLRTFRIDIETDSTIAMNEQEAMESWAKYLEGLNFIFQNVQAISQFRPELTKPMLESAMGAIRQLRTGRSVEQAWEKAMDEIEEGQKQAAMEPPPPDPAMMKAQVDQQKVMQEGQKAQAEFQLKQQEMQYEMQKCEFEKWEKSQRLSLDSMKINGELQLKQQANEITAGKEMGRAEIDKIFADLEGFKTQLKQSSENYKLQLETARLEFEKQAKILEMQEKLMEEKRLNRQDNIEEMRIVTDHVNKTKANEIKEASLEG